MSTPRIAVDVMGGDNAPGAIVAGAVAAARESKIPVTLVGPDETVRRELERLGPTPEGLEIAHASDVIGMAEHISSATRHRRESTIVVGLELVKRGGAAAFLSAGNTGAVMSLATLTLGRQPGVDRPALGTVFPSVSGRFLLLDVGANADVRPPYLVQFALLGRKYAERVMRIANPRVGLPNIGEEPGKGSELARDVHERLAATTGLNFVGNLEGKDLTRGLADVVVTDGFTGNVALKTAEGAADFILREMRSALTSKLRYKLAALVLRPALLQLRARIDYASYGGAPLLGLNGTVLISHGRSDARAIAAAVRVARETAEAQPAGAELTAQSSSRATGSGDES
jgi:glycerol-3-phosphate acyltransferase PlsX